MKKLLLMLSFGLFVSVACAQSLSNTLLIISPDSARFTVRISGYQVNKTPGSRVVCKGIYLYTVNGTDYIATPNYKTNALAETVIIYYNPSNPSETHTLTNMSFFMIIGLILVIMAILVYIGVLKLISYIFDNAALMIDEIPTTNKNQN